MKVIGMRPRRKITVLIATDILRCRTEEFFLFLFFFFKFYLRKVTFSQLFDVSQLVTNVSPNPLPLSRGPSELRARGFPLYDMTHTTTLIDYASAIYTVQRACQCYGSDMIYYVCERNNNL